MAKSVRASVSKRNRANLRKKVFGPVVDARTERLAAKLQEIASQPKPEAPKKAEVEMDSDETGMWAATCLREIPVLTTFVSPAGQQQRDEKTTQASEGRLTRSTFNPPIPMCRLLTTLLFCRDGC